MILYVINPFLSRKYLEKCSKQYAIAFFFLKSILPCQIYSVLLITKLSDREPSRPGGDAWPCETSEAGQQDGGVAVRSGFHCPAALAGRAAAARDRDLFPPLAKRGSLSL